MAVSSRSRRSANAAKQTGVAAAYLSDVENGKKNLAEDRLNKLIELYEIDADEAEELREQATHRGWWSKYSALQRRTPALLRLRARRGKPPHLRQRPGAGPRQAAPYARAIIDAGAPNLRLAEVDRRVQCRLTRARRLIADDPLQITTVMSEAAIRQRWVGPRFTANSSDTSRC
ncbi:hypothetical protein GCM10027597_33100 [Saccharopolyspora tripterygii]